MNTALYAFASVALVSIAAITGLFFLSVREEKLKKILFFLVSLAAGALLGDAFLHLIPESFENMKDPSFASLLIIAGIFSFFMLEKLLRWHHHEPLEHYHADTLDSGSKHIGPMILWADGIHNFLDGVIIWAGYSAGIEVGIATTIAILLHEIPQEIGDFGVLLHSGYGRMKALLFNFISALAAVLGTAFAATLGAVPENFFNGLLPFAAGIFVYIASADLIPELQKNTDAHAKKTIFEFIGIGLGIFIMYLLLFLE